MDTLWVHSSFTIMNTYIYLSPHLDDVVLSLGGLIYEQTRQGDDVSIWTVCAGDPPTDRPLTDYGQMMHILWELGDDVPYKRSREDAAACRVLGASFRRYTVPDNIYRYLPGTDEAVVKVPDDNFGALEPVESYLIPPVTDWLRKNISDDAHIVAPLAIGHHRDHVLTRKAAEGLGIALWRYVDYPYVIRDQYDLADWIPETAERYTVPLTSADVEAWQEAIACYRSQLLMLWPDENDMRQAIQDYAQSGGGATLYRF